MLLSRWSTWFGLPVGLPAIVTYGCVFGLLLRIGSGRPQRIRRGDWMCLLPLATLIAGASLWFMGLQLFALKSMCPYCIGLHVCGLALAAILFWNLPIAWPPADVSGRRVPSSFNSGIGLILVGLVGMGILIGGQIAISPPERGFEVHATPAAPVSKSFVAESFESRCTGNAVASAAATNPPQSLDKQPSSTALAEADPWARPGPHRRLALVGGKVVVDVDEVPTIGDPRAEWVIAEMFDYTCPECRSLHHRTHEALARYGGRLTLALLPTPINADCNKYVAVTKTPHEHACEYARLALAVWNARPSSFMAYHNWLMEPVEPPALAVARSRAAELLGQKSLDETLAGDRVARQLADDTRIYHLLDAGAVPKLLLPGHVLVGSPASTDKLCESLEAYHGVAR